MWRIYWAPNSIPIYIQQDATLHSLFISGNCSKCFGWYFHPSSGAHTTVSTASGICTPLLLSAAIVKELEPVWVCCGWRTPQLTAPPAVCPSYILKFLNKKTRIFQIDLTTRETGLILIKSDSRGLLLFAPSVFCCLLFVIIIIIIFFFFFIIIKFRMPQLKTKEAITEARHMTTFRNLFSTRSVVLFTKEAIPR